MARARLQGPLLCVVRLQDLGDLHAGAVRMRMREGHVCRGYAGAMGALIRLCAVQRLHGMWSRIMCGGPKAMQRRYLCLSLPRHGVHW